MGWATLRDSWENNATMLAVKCGFSWNHTHSDAGSYILYHNGKNLIIDGGTSSYGTPRYADYYSLSEAHNVVLFNGEGQDKRDRYFGVVHSGSLHNLVEGTDFKYLLANATGPYAKILARNYRHFIWVGDVILVIDDLLAHQPGQFEWLLHYNGESKRNAYDLSIYCRMLGNDGILDGKRILSPEAVTMLTNAQIHGRAFGFDVNSSYSWVKGSYTS